MKKLILTVCVLFAASMGFAASEKAGSVSLAKGSVDVVKADAVMGKMAKQGQTLLTDDILRTKRKGYAEVNFVDGSLIKVFEKSRLLFSGIGRTTDGYNAEIQKGKVLFKIEKMQDVAGDFRIKTTNAIIGVKGTALAVETGAAGTTVEVYRGVVVISQDRPTAAGTGSGPRIAPRRTTTLTGGHGVTVSSSGTVTTYRFGGESGGLSRLFSGAEAAVGTDADEGAVFSGIGEGAGADEMEGGDGSGGSDMDVPQGGQSQDTSDIAQSLQDASQSTQQEIASSVVDEIVDVADDIPDTDEQIDEAYGGVRINIHFD